jgi:hypothetical protein
MTETLALRRAKLMALAVDLRNWAASKHLLGSGMAPIPDSEKTLSAAARGFSAESIGAMQKARLTGFSVDVSKNTIYILGNLKPSKKLRETLPKALQDDVKIAYAQARPSSIGEQPDAASLLVQNSSLAAGRFTCGASVSPANNRIAGTLGCLVRRDNKLFGLSNNHVTGGCSFLPTEMPILAPGVMDVVADGPLPVAIGRHETVLPMVPGDPSIVDVANNSDAAIFEILDPDKVSSAQRNYFDTPTGVVEPAAGMHVEKIGRTTDRTEGIIHSEQFGFRPVRYKFTVPLSADDETPVNFTASFPNVWLIEGKHGPFGQPGDSGSLIVTTNSAGKRAAIGLLFAGGDDFTYMLEIGPILQRLGVKLVGGHNFV